MRKVIAAPIVAGLIGFAALAAPLAASAATNPDTTTTFTVDGGSLTINAPASNSLLGTYTLGTTTTDLSALLGTVTVVDNRADLTTPSWTASVASTAFTTGAATADETIPASAVNYSPGSASNPVNSPTTTYTPGTAGPLGGDPALTAMSASGEVGVGGVSWDPTITVHLPAQVVAGSYSGTITHSVA